MYSKRKEIRVSQGNQEGSTAKGMLALGIMVLAVVAAFKYSGGMPKGP